MENEKETPVKGIVKALADFQQACPSISKESKAGQGSFSYKYGSLPHIIETIKPHLKKAGLVFTQPISYREGAQFIYTTVYDVKTGEKIESKMLLPEIEFKGMNAVQSGGAVITYIRRYTLMSILGLVTDDDDTDAQGKTEQRGKGAKGSTEGAAPKEVKPYLNPKVDGNPNPKWNQAVKYLADGGTIEEIKKKYRVGKANEDRLLEQALTFDDLPFDRKDAEAGETPGAGGDGVNKDFDNQGPGGEKFPDGESGPEPGDNPDHY